MVPISYDAAKASGLKRYFTGAPCKRGHIAERRIANKTCVLCSLIHGRNGYETHRDDLQAKSKARMNALYAKDPDRLRERSRKNYAANPAAWKKRIREWQAAHPIHVRTSHHLKKRRHVDGTFCADDLMAKFDAQKGHCLCGADLTIAWQIDHILPICRGGANWPENIQILCPDCNKDKGTKTMDEWRSAS